MSVCDNRLRIEQVLGGRSSTEVETDFILRLVRSKELTLHQWKIAYSGYSWGEVAQGTSTEELIDYLHLKDLPEHQPDFATVEETLMKVLFEPEIKEKFRFGGFWVREWLCQARILYRDQNQHPDEVMELVGARCDLPCHRTRICEAPHFKFMNSPIGEFVQWGYSREVGYDHDNEFPDWPTTIFADL